jgi:hypothetical protein
LLSTGGAFDCHCQFSWIGGLRIKPYQGTPFSGITGFRRQAHQTTSPRFTLDCDLSFDRRRVQNNGGNAMKYFNHESTDPGQRPPILAPRVHRSWATNWRFPTISDRNSAIGESDTCVASIADPAVFSSLAVVFQQF